MIIILNPVDTLGFGKRKRRERRESAAAAAGAPTPSGAFCFCWTVRSSGPRLQTCGRHRGAELSGGGSTSLTRPSILDLPRPFIHGDGTSRKSSPNVVARKNNSSSEQRPGHQNAYLPYTSTIVHYSRYGVGDTVKPTRSLFTLWCR